jgi:hypothetical protein
MQLIFNSLCNPPSQILSKLKEFEEIEKKR